MRVEDTSSKISELNLSDASSFIKDEKAYGIKKISKN
jgi:hypothetical protein